ncbi:MAG TPA: hypothetical protein VM433_08690 [Mycobacteriales bacterium]|nr:hypothetical protein [Mycobacteriales bacterium]
MESTARRALSDLIGQLQQPAPARPAAGPPPVRTPPPVLPAQRAPEQPAALAPALTVLPAGATSAILWRSRSA